MPKFSPVDIVVSSIISGHTNKYIYIYRKNYKLVSYQGTHILYKKEKGITRSKRVINIEEIFEKLDPLHQAEGKHFGRTKLYKSVTQQYHGITEEICGLYVSTCKTCHLKKAKKYLKIIVTKPIMSQNYLSRGQVDLIDLLIRI